MPEDDPSLFKIYVQWLYTDKIFTKTNDKWGSLDYERLGHLYCLGEKLIDKQFQNRVIDALVTGTREEFPREEGGITTRYPTKESVDAVYKGTPIGSPARRLMVDLHVRHGAQEWIANDTMQNVEFLVDLTRALLGTRVFPDGRAREYAELDKKTSSIPKSYYQGIESK